MSERKIEKAHSLANQYARNTVKKVIGEMKEVFGDKPLDYRKLEEYVGREIALAYGKGWMNGVEKRALFRPDGTEIF